MDKKQANNYPIQGSSFHMLLWTLIQTIKKLHKYKMKTLVIGEVHDSQISDGPEKELKAYGEITEEIVSVDLPKQFPWLVVPMKSSIEVAPAGLSWYEKKKFVV